ncbi:MAG TPA: PP2C family serine/threonine-protein phosphatase, partial [Niastella sp.]
MSDIKLYIQALFNGKGITIANNRAALFNAFISDEENSRAVNQILENQKMLTNKWILNNRITDIQQQAVSIPNATVGKRYETKLDFINLGWNDIIYSELIGVEQAGLIYDNEKEVIEGTPTQSGDIKIILRFRINGEPEDSVLNEKNFSLIVNPDPKSLWKNIPSDKEDKYWKEDIVCAFGKLGDKNIVVASKRGRSHANAGSFRDDDFAYEYFENTGWSVVAVADGAGSAKLSRKGSQLACNAITTWFGGHLNTDELLEFDNVLLDFKIGTGEEPSKRLSHCIYNILSKAAHFAHNEIADFANKTETQLKDYYSTLIFTFFKKYEFGYAVLSFGIGDCPIALINKDQSEVTLMNWLDVGEFGGGTRFINMPEIFTSDKFPTRFRFKLIEDFSYLMLMTDGIYDPKFVVEANLEKLENWTTFINDLGGNNDDQSKVDFHPDNSDIGNQLSTWMDFWSPGN